MEVQKQAQNNNPGGISKAIRKCSKCKTNRVQFLCLDQECIKENLNLFCRACNKEQKKRHKTYIIDKQSAPLSLFGLNCFNQNKEAFVHFLQNTMEKCSTQWNQKMQKVIMKHQNLLEQQIFNHLGAIIQTCQEQKTQQVYKLMIETSISSNLYQSEEILAQEFQQINKNIKLMKWIQNHENFIRDGQKCEKAVQIFSRKYQNQLNKVFKKINILFQKFFQMFNSKTLFFIQNQDESKNQQIGQRSEKKQNKQKKIKKIRVQSKIKPQVSKNNTSTNSNNSNNQNQAKSSQSNKDEPQKDQSGIRNNLNQQLQKINKTISDNQNKDKEKDIPALYNNNIHKVFSPPPQTQEKSSSYSQNKLLKNEYFQSKNYSKLFNGIKSQNENQLPIIQIESKNNHQNENKNKIIYSQLSLSSILKDQEIKAQQKKLLQVNQKSKNCEESFAIPKQIQVKIQANTQYGRNSQQQKKDEEKQKLYLTQKQKKKTSIQKSMKDKKSQQLLIQNSKKMPYRNKQKMITPDSIYRLTAQNYDRFLQREIQKIKCLYLQYATPYFLNIPKNYDSLFNTNQQVQEIHIFDLEFSKERLYDLLLAYPNLIRLIINCDNELENLMWYFEEKFLSEKIKKENLNISKFQSLFGMETIESSGIYYKDLQIIDSKKYFPQKLFCAKILDEKWEQIRKNQKNKEKEKETQIVNQNSIYEKETTAIQNELNNIKDQKIGTQQSISMENNNLKSKKNKNNTVEKNIAEGHTQICWYYYQDYTKKDYRYSKCPLRQQSCFTLLELNPSIRNFTLADLSQTALFKQKMESVDLTWIQDITLGQYTKILQPIPKEILIKLSTVQNIQSLTFLNLNISELMFGMLFRYTKNLKSLILQFCTPLSNIFYKNLYKRAPNLKKLSVNNLKNVKGEFISKLKHLQTLILPWSQIDMHQSDLNNQKQSQYQQNQEIQEEFSPLKLKYINLYGSKWILEKQFFLMLDENCIESLNIGKMTIGSKESDSEAKRHHINRIIQKLATLQNLNQICFDGLPITTKNLIDFLSIKTRKNNPNFLNEKKQNLNKLSLAHCQKINLDEITLEEWRLFDNITHLDLRNKNSKWNENLQNLKNLKHLSFDLSGDIQKSLRVKKMLVKSVFIYQ